MFKYRISLVESELGWGRKVWSEDFDTPEEAQARIDEVNSHNDPTGPVPDYYIKAFREIKAVRVSGPV